MAAKKQEKSPTIHHSSFHLGSKLKLLRTSRKLTMDALSKSAGVSKAMLSQIEQDKVNPTVAVMMKIACALDVSIMEMLENPQRENILRIIRNDEEQYTFRSDPLCRIRTLSPLSLEKTIEFYSITLEPNGKIDSEAHFPGTEEILHVTRGKLKIQTGAQTIELHKGDSIHYRADIEHKLSNCAKGTGEAFLIVRYREE